MITRPFKLSDWKEVNDIWLKYHATNFGLPPISQTCFTEVTEHEGKIICAGIIHLIPEAIIVMDLDSPIGPRIRAIEALLERGKANLHEQGYENLHCFVQDLAFENFLRKRCGFTDVRGKALVSIIEG
jgi:hypothetical protein